VVRRIVFSRAEFKSRTGKAGSGWVPNTTLETINMFFALSEFLRRRLWLQLDSPDSRSGRALKFIIRPKKNPLAGIVLLRWSYGKNVRLERWLANIGVYPE